MLSKVNNNFFEIEWYICSTVAISICRLNLKKTVRNTTELSTKHHVPQGHFDMTAFFILRAVFQAISIKCAMVNVLYSFNLQFVGKNVF